MHELATGDKLHSLLVFSKSSYIFTIPEAGQPACRMVNDETGTIRAAMSGSPRFCMPHKNNKPYLVHPCGQVFKTRKDLERNGTKLGLQPIILGCDPQEWWTCPKCGSTFMFSIPPKR